MTTNFDRAAAFYDETRGLPETTLNDLVDRITRALHGIDEVLEIGVGTGRIAIPLSERGFCISGIDVSEQMLAVLTAKSSAVKARLADATELPFEADSFGAVLAVDVFHLLSEWCRVVDEIVRVLHPGGRIVLSKFAVLDDPTAVLQQRIFEEAGTQPRRVGVEITDVLADLKNRFGTKSSEVASIPYITTTTLKQELDDLRAGTWSRYWEMPDDLRARVADSLEDELRSTGAELAKPVGIGMSLVVLMATLV